MNRFKVLLVVALVLAALTLAAGDLAAGDLAAQASPPNIIMIFSDDQGFHDVGCYGSEIKTPELDRLASEGMRFTQFYAASSICTPSRYGLLTGRYAHRSADQLTAALMFLAEEDKSRGIRDGETTYVLKLKQHGYRTALVGKWHLGSQAYSAASLS